MAARAPPADWLGAYTMNNTIQMEEFYIDESIIGVPGGFRYDRAYLEECVSVAATHYSGTRNMRRRSAVKRHIGGVKRDDVIDAIGTDGAVSVNQKRVVVFGAADPWVECFAIAAGASHVMTVEWNLLAYDHSNMSSMHVDAFEQAIDLGGHLRSSFDVAIALSAFDHNGLGRYGDRLNPYGDLMGMRSAWRSLRLGGRLLLSAPVGPDLLVWNLHRRYGARRLPLLLDGWHEEVRIDWQPKRLTAAADHLQRYEPLFVLLRNSTEELSPLPTLAAPPLDDQHEMKPQVETEASSNRGVRPADANVLKSKKQHDELR